MAVHVPQSLDDLVQTLRARPTAVLVAGGTDLMVEVNEGRGHPSGAFRADDADVVALNRVSELRSWSFDPAAGTVTLGSAVTYAEIMDAPICDLLPALAQAARTVGSPQIRHAATIGGNLATASPAGDGLPVLAALEAVVHLRSAEAVRDVDFANFTIGPKRTVLQPGEVITGVTVPVLRGWQGYSKIGVRNAMVISAAGACLAVDEDHRNIRIALGSVGPTIIRCVDAEQFAAQACDFHERTVSNAAAAEFAELTAAAARPIDDHRSTADYRRHAIRVMAGRLLRRAFPHDGVDHG
jgi:CO/xanthine dehydrogenase FAD-binding subunit